MKTFFVTAFILSSFLPVSFLHADDFVQDVKTQKIEVSVKKLFAPYKGYDSTNNIEVVLYGLLPNPCYRLDNYGVEKSADGRTIRIHQYAVKKTDGICADERSLPEHLKMTVPFTHVVSLGSMPSGSYTFTYNETEGQMAQRSLTIKEAHKTTIDDYPYAAITEISTSDVISKNNKISLILSGVFTSTCAYLDKDSVKVEKQNDVYVVYPVVKMKEGVFCLQTLMPFAHEVEMGAPDVAGEYLIHVRSMNGKSVNRVVVAQE